VAGPKLPFNQDWGHDFLTDLHKVAQQLNPDYRIKANFPEHFPVVKQFYLTAENHLVVIKWTGNPPRSNEPRSYNNKNLLAFETQGTSLEPTSYDFQWDRIRHVGENTLIVSVYNPELEVYTLASCRKDALPTLLALFPRQVDPL